MVAHQVFGLLTVLAADPDNSRYRLCRCRCGTEKHVRADHLNGGKIISCGCEAVRRSSERAHVMHAANVTHGATKTRAYRVWAGMRSRCENPRTRAFVDYGGRGIAVCPRWRYFEAFLADMGQPGPGEEIERVDNNRGYEPGNCRWATRQEQQNNRRTNRLITHGGVTQTVAQWAAQLGLAHGTISKRLKLEMPTDLVLSRSSFAGRPRRVTHCRRGHAFDDENTRIAPHTGQRVCRACHREREKQRARRGAP